VEINNNNSINVLSSEFGIISRGGLKTINMHSGSGTGSCAPARDPSAPSSYKAVSVGKTWKVKALILDCSSTIASNTSSVFAIGYADNAALTFAGLVNPEYVDAMIKSANPSSVDPVLRNVIPVNFEIPAGKYPFISSPSSSSITYTGIMIYEEV